MLLGPVALAATGAPTTTVGGAKLKGVLAVLALSSPYPVPTAQIIDSLWGERAPATARGAVQVYVSGLRKLLASVGGSLERVGDSYALRGEVTVDVARFRSRASEGRAALRSGHPDRAAEMLTEALSLCQGRPLDGLDALAFTASTRTTLDDARASTLLDLASAQLAAGHLAEALDTARLAVAARRYDEAAWIVLSRALYHCGRQDDALAECRRIRAILADELGVDPTAALAELEQQLLTHTLPPLRTATDTVPEPESAPLNVPPLPDFYVDRGHLVTEVADALASGTRRLITLTGMGGIGKTTIALAVSHELARQGVPVAFCPLEAESLAAGAMARTAHAAGLDAGVELVSSLRSEYDGVIVLDNVEQIADLPPVVSRLIESPSGLRLLATSRRSLGVPGEKVVPVPSLSAGADGAPGAVDLFVAIARNAGADIPDDPPAEVAQLCELLDGIPLSIEIAATRTRTISPGRLLDRLRHSRDSLLDLASGRTDERRATLRAIIRDSTSTLGPDSRGLLEVLASFDGWVSLDLLEVAAASRVEGDALEALDQLVEGGLAIVDGDGRTRLREPVREFAARLGPRAHLDDELVRAVLALCTAEGPRLTGPTTTAALARLSADDAALWRAIQLSAERGAAQTAAQLARSLHRYWLLTGRIVEGRLAFEQILAMQGHSEVDLAWLALIHATFGFYLHTPDAREALLQALEQAGRFGLPADRVHVNGWCCRAAQLAEHADSEAWNACAKAQELASHSGDATLVALARDLEGFIAAHLGDDEIALDVALRSVEDARHAGDDYDLALCLNAAAEALLSLRRDAEALAFSHEALERAAELDVSGLTAAALLFHGMVLAVVGDLAPAEGTLLETLRVCRDVLPSPIQTADALFIFGTCAASRHRDALAARCFGAAEALYEDNGLARDRRGHAALQAVYEEFVERVGAARYRTLAAVGRSDPSRVVSLLVG